MAAENPFSDLDADHWATPAVLTAVSRGWVSGYPDGTFRPGKSVTRAETVAILNRALGRRGEGFAQNRTGQVFTDLLEGHWATEDIIEASGASPVEPGPEPAFQPAFTTVGTTRVIDAPFIDQLQRYPNGCESVCAVMALQYLGVEITPEQFIDGFLPQSSEPYYNSAGQFVAADPRQVFLGSPYSEDGWGCYAPAIAGALRRAVGEAPLTVEEHYGQSLAWLTETYVSRGIPVLVWATIDMAPR